MKIRLFISSMLFFLSFLLYGQDYSPGLDENDIINYLNNFPVITEEYQKIYTDKLKEIDRLSIQFSLKISLYLYGNELTLFNENDIRTEFLNIITTFYPAEVYEIMEKYGIYNKNFILLFTIINVIYTSKIYFKTRNSSFGNIIYI